MVKPHLYDKLCERDADELNGLRHRLHAARLTAGLSPRRVGEQIGHSRNFVRCLEAEGLQTHLSGFQKVASVYGLRVRPVFWGVAPVAGDGELAALRLMADEMPWTPQWERVWLMGVLRSMRVNAGWSAGGLSRSLGWHGSTVARWESYCTDPYMSAVMVFVRTLGGCVQWDLDELVG